MARPKAFDREAALEQAMYTFWKCGYEATSMQDLVNAMGINRQSLYDTFGDKHGLYLETLEHYRCTDGQEFIKFLDETKPLRKRLETAFAALIDESLNDKDKKGCFIANATLELASCDTSVRRFVEANLEQVVQRLEREFTRAQAKGELAKDKQPRALALFLMNTIQGLRVTTKAKVDKKMLESIVKTTLTALD
jgi:TetR/AcrR family transcriptional regulator, transcriptional repressor for nem operon